MRGSIPTKSSSSLTPNSIPNCDTCGKEFKSNGQWLHYEPDCDCIHKKYIRNEQKQKGKLGIENIYDIKINSGIGLRFAGKNFSNYIGNEKAKKDCMEWVKNYMDNFKSGKGLFITGTVGTGKTHLLSAIIDYIARVKKRLHLNHVIYRTAPAMLNEIRNSYENKDFEDVITRFKLCHLLIIDDLGAEKTTDWVLDIFFEIIDSRYAQLKPIIIATNLTDIEIKQKLDERIMSRIYEMSKGIRLTGKDYRLG